MSINEKNKNIDKFAAIAQNGKIANGEIKRLEEVKPLKIAHKRIKEKTCTINRYIFNEEVEYNRFLKEKESLKKKYLPFLQDYSKKLCDVKVITPLVDFEYKKETDEDKINFFNIIEGNVSFEKIKIPHYTGPDGRWTAYYRKELVINKKENKRYIIDFQAVDYIAEVFIGNRLVKRHEGFFAPFTADITDYIVSGKNILVVVVKNDVTTTSCDINGIENYGNKIYGATNIGYDEPNLGWHHCPAGAGIFGRVNLVECNEQIVSDIYVKPNIDNGEIEVNTTLFNFAYDNISLDIFYTVEGKNFKKDIFFNKQGICDKLGVDENYLKETFKIDNYLLWTQDEPYLYSITATIKNKNGEIVDCKKTHFGMRKFYMDENSTPKGKFYFNNKRIMLRGANEMGHLPRCVMENDYDKLLEDILIAKVANMNFYRMTQRPVFSEIYDYFDMTGMLCQTDFPLFSYLKPSALGEALKQVDEMELLTRNHPCVVVETFCNEALDKTAWAKEQYTLSRFEIERFFRAAHEVVKIRNTDRVLKYNEGDYAPLPKGYGINDFHCYTFWYVSHGLPSGKMNKGYLPPFRKDWMAGCGEYGCDGLDRLELMKKYCPKEWLPQNDDDLWSPKKIAKEQCFVLHGDFFPEQNTIKDWIEVSRKHQYNSTKELTHILRRRADYIESSAIHLLIDAWPCGWTKTLVDVDRVPKPAFYAYKDSLIPLRVSLRRDKYVVYSGDKISVEVYALNDLAEDKLLKVNLALSLNGKIEKTYSVEKIAKGSIQTYFGDVYFSIPKDFIGKVEVFAETDNKTYDSVSFEVRQKNKKTSFKPQINGTKLQSIYSLCDGIKSNKVLICDNEYYSVNKERLESEAFNGSKIIVFANRPLVILDEKITFRVNELEEEVRANNFVARSNSSKYTKEFNEEDFKNFYNAKKDYQDLTAWFKFEWKDAEEILYTFEDCNQPKYALHKKHKLIVAQKKYGMGSIILSTLSCIDGCVGFNPVLDKFLINLIEK